MGRLTDRVQLVNTTPVTVALATPDPGQVWWSASVLWFVLAEKGDLYPGVPVEAWVHVGPWWPANLLSWN